MVGEIADVLERWDRTPEVRAIVLCAEGKHFCAGADFGSRGPDGVARGTKRGRHLYKEAQRLWRTGKPIVASVHGAAVGAGVGLAVMADFRVTCPEARFSVNFTRLGFSSRVWPDRNAAAIDRGAAGIVADVYRTADHRRAGACDRTGGLLRAAGPRSVIARLNLRPRSPSRRHWRSSRPGKPCGAVWRMPWQLRPSANTRSRTGCATPKTSARASKRWRNADCRTSGRSNPSKATFAARSFGGRIRFGGRRATPNAGSSQQWHCITPGQSDRQTVWEFYNATITSINLSVTTPWQFSIALHAYEMFGMQSLIAVSSRWWSQGHGDESETRQQDGRSLRGNTIGP